MTETLHGPWRIVASNVESYPAQAFRIKGSSNADGHHPVFPGQPLELLVDGTEWTLTIVHRQFDDITLVPGTSNRWVDSQPVLVDMTVERPEPGLLVRLDSHRTEFDTYWTGLTLTCICEDPELNPPFPPVPYDFGYPLF